MMSGTPPLYQNRAKPSNKTNRGTQLQQMLPTLLINIVVPFLINIVARRYMPTINALLLASSVPAMWTLGSLIVKKRIDIVGVSVVAGLLLTAAFALVFKTPRFLLLQTSAIMGLFGVVMLISLLFPRPALFYLVRSVQAQSDPRRFASFNADWSFPQVRTFYRKLTAVWGCVTIAHLLLQAILAFTLPISLMLVLNPILSIIVVSPAVFWTRHITRKNKPMFDQLHPQY